MALPPLIEQQKRRLMVLFQELGYTVDGIIERNQGLSGSIHGLKDIIAQFTIDSRLKFTEISFKFNIPYNLAPGIRKRLHDISNACYEFGCYYVLITEEELSLQICTKLYYSGMNYQSLEETLEDFQKAVNTIYTILDTDSEMREGSSNGNS